MHWRSFWGKYGCIKVSGSQSNCWKNKCTGPLPRLANTLEISKDHNGCNWTTNFQVLQLNITLKNLHVWVYGIWLYYIAVFDSLLYVYGTIHLSGPGPFPLSLCRPRPNTFPHSQFHSHHHLWTYLHVFNQLLVHLLNKNSLSTSLSSTPTLTQLQPTFFTSLFNFTFSWLFWSHSKSNCMRYLDEGQF